MVVDLRPIISREVGLEEIETAMQLLDGGDVGKIIIRPNVAVDVTPAPERETPPDPERTGAAVSSLGRVVGRLVSLPCDIRQLTRGTLTPASSAGQALALSHDGRGDKSPLNSTATFKRERY